MLRQCFSSGTAADCHTSYKAQPSQNWPKIATYDHVHQIFIASCTWFRRGVLCDPGFSWYLTTAVSYVRLGRQSDNILLTHCSRVTHIFVSKFGRCLFRWWLVLRSMSSHYLNQCWFIAIWTVKNKFHYPAVIVIRCLGLQMLSAKTIWGYTSSLNLIEFR